MTRSDWHSLLARFQHSTHWQEKLLYRKLNNSVWPIVMDIHRVRAPLISARGIIVC